MQCEVLLAGEVGEPVFREETIEEVGGSGPGVTVEFAGGIDVVHDADGCVAAEAVEEVARGEKRDVGGFAGECELFGLECEHLGLCETCGRQRLAPIEDLIDRSRARPRRDEHFEQKTTGGRLRFMTLFLTAFAAAVQSAAMPRQARIEFAGACSQTHEMLIIIACLTPFPCLPPYTEQVRPY